MRYNWIYLISLVCLPSLSIAADKVGWTPKIKSEFIIGCASTIEKTTTDGVRQQSGLAASEPLPKEVKDAIANTYVPAFKKACACAVDKIAIEHAYKDLDKNSEVLKKAGALIGTPNGCPLDI